MSWSGKYEGGWAKAGEEWQTSSWANGGGLYDDRSRGHGAPWADGADWDQDRSRGKEATWSEAGWNSDRSRGHESARSDWPDRRPSHDHSNSQAYWKRACHTYTDFRQMEAAAVADAHQQPQQSPPHTALVAVERDDDQAAVVTPPEQDRGSPRLGENPQECKDDCQQVPTQVQPPMPNVATAVAESATDPPTQRPYISLNFEEVWRDITADAASEQTRGLPILGATDVGPIAPNPVFKHFSQQLTDKTHLTAVFPDAAAAAAQKDSEREAAAAACAADTSSQDPSQQLPPQQEPKLKPLLVWTPSLQKFGCAADPSSHDPSQKLPPQLKPKPKPTPQLKAPPLPKLAQAPPPLPPPKALPTTHLAAKATGVAAPCSQGRWQLTPQPKELPPQAKQAPPQLPPPTPQQAAVAAVADTLVFDNIEHIIYNEKFFDDLAGVLREQFCPTHWSEHNCAAKYLRWDAMRKGHHSIDLPTYDIDVCGIRHYGKGPVFKIEELSVKKWCWMDLVAMLEPQSRTKVFGKSDGLISCSFQLRDLILPGHDPTNLPVWDFIVKRSDGTEFRLHPSHSQPWVSSGEVKLTPSTAFAAVGAFRNYRNELDVRDSSEVDKCRFARWE